MIDLEGLVHKCMDLEARYYELLGKYQDLIYEYEKLKEENGLATPTDERAD